VNEQILLITSGLVSFVQVSDNSMIRTNVEGRQFDISPLFLSLSLSLFLMQVILDELYKV
jgi:hypothetical protein